MSTLTTTIGEVANITMGQSPKGSTYNIVGDGAPLLNGPTEFGLYHPHATLFTTDSKRECEKNDLIFCVRGSTTGRMNWADKSYSLGRGVCAIKSDSIEETRFIKYCLDNNLRALLKVAGGSTFPNLSRQDIASFLLPWPVNRKQIARTITHYNQLIENGSKRIEKLESVAYLLYRDYFGIPESAEWEALPLGKVLIVHRGKSYKSSELSETKGMSFVNLKCVNRGGGFRKNGLKLFTGSFKPHQQVEKGDLVMAVTDMTQERMIVARAARVPSLDGGHGVISMDMVKIEPKVNISKDYLYAMFRWSDFANEVKNHANGANVLHLAPSRITDYVTNIPPIKLQREYSEKVLPVFNLIDNLQQKNESLAKARDLLLPRLMSGEIEV